MPVTANAYLSEEELLERAILWLRERLPGDWAVGRPQRSLGGDAGGEPRALDAAIEIRADASFATFVVEARAALSPRDAELLLPRVARSLRALAGNAPVLVVAPWLSGRTQELLAAEGLSFLDLTGNALIRLQRPALFLQSTGAARNPNPPPRGQARVRGPKAGRLVRLLADVRPPYGVQQIAAATGLNPGYISRLIEALDREALIDRDPRGPVRSVDVPALIRRWTESYDVFRSNSAVTYLAPSGPAAALDRLRGRTQGRVAVTGSFAAVRRAPVAAPALLAAYCDDPAVLADELGLLPADSGANVVLLRPFDPVVWTHLDRDEGLDYAAVTQVAADCLTGNGRMPAEGEALLDWMTRDESAWRLPALAAGGKS